MQRLIWRSKSNFLPYFWYHFDLKLAATLKPSACTQAFFSKILLTIYWCICSHQKKFLFTMCNRKEYVGTQSSLINSPFFHHLWYKNAQAFLRFLCVAYLGPKWWKNGELMSELWVPLYSFLLHMVRRNFFWWEHIHQWIVNKIFEKNAWVQALGFSVAANFKSKWYQK